MGRRTARKLEQAAQALLKENVKERPAATISQRRRFLEHITATDPKRLHRQAADEAAGLHSKRDCEGAGTRRVAVSSLENDGSPNHLMLGDWCLWMRWTRT